MKAGERRDAAKQRGPGRVDRLTTPGPSQAQGVRSSKSQAIGFSFAARTASHPIKNRRQLASDVGHLGFGIVAPDSSEEEPR
ncbi:hypothetical protein, partial [Mesorhizobium sp. M7A.F.Ca.CA.004.01.1.1]|uniref:hypothetical protein n=1 Tax=Mesorhizobium sp. M7A.F.Ca.CA.004.01.1.1 TaxID=2496689 RepID=UPI0019D1644D